MNPAPKFSVRKLPIWSVAGLSLGTLAAGNPFYHPHISVEVGIAVWFLDLALSLCLLTHPIGRRIGILLTGFLLSVPCFVRASPFVRCVLICCSFLPCAIVALQPPEGFSNGFRERIGFLISWMGTREVKRRPRTFEVSSLLQLIAATAVLVAMVAIVKSFSPAGTWQPVRWFAGGIMILAFAAMSTTFHSFFTAALGVVAPGLFQSPHLSRSVTEFWTKRWNPGASLIFRKACFEPVARYSAVTALFLTFLASAIGHALLPFMALGRWNISLACGAFFFVQPLFIAIERLMGVRHWPPAAGWAWTMIVLALTSPLFVEPALQIIEPSWGASNDLLTPTIGALIIVICGDLFFSLFALIAEPRVAHIGTTTLALRQAGGRSNREILLKRGP